MSTDNPHVTNPQCTAKSKRTGRQCQRPAMTGTTVCYHHGGKTPFGHNLPQTKSGRYSRHLPTRLSASYERALADPDLVAMDSELALVDARMLELLQRIDAGDSAKAWRAIVAAWEQFKRARTAKDTTAMGAALDAIGNAITDLHVDERWGEVLDLVERRRRLAESEQKRRVAAGHMITMERAMLLFSAVSDVIRTHVSDPDTMRAIAADFRAMLDRTGNGTTQQLEGGPAPWQP